MRVNLMKLRSYITDRAYKISRFAGKYSRQIAAVFLVIAVATVVLLLLYDGSGSDGDPAETMSESTTDAIDGTTDNKSDKTIQYAIEHVPAGSIIAVSPGIYSERLDLTGRNRLYITNAGSELPVLSGGSYTDGYLVEISGLNSDNNIFFTDQGNGRFKLSGEYASTLEQWRLISGQDMHSFISDPSFVKPGSDFHLRSESPAQGYGRYL
jgi:hypothetical protein